MIKEPFEHFAKVWLAVMLKLQSLSDQACQNADELSYLKDPSVYCVSMPPSERYSMLTIAESTITV